MTENEQNKQSDFMFEKMKERPMDKKKLLRRTIMTASMAVIFGLIACLTFLILEPVFTRWLYPEEKPQIIVFPEELDEISPEDMMVENVEPNIQETVENILLDGSQIEEILSKVKLNMENYKQLYTSMSDFVITLNKSMVTVTGVTSSYDLFYNTLQSKDIASGIIVANNGKELLILVDQKVIKGAEKITVTFCDAQQVEATQKQSDSATGLCVLSIMLSDISDSTLEEITVAALGSSNSRYMAGTPIIALGSPMGNSNSINYGIVSTPGTIWSTTDANYKIFMTDIYGSQNATGALFNLQGQIIGIITTGKNESDMKNIVSALGITELRKVIEKMSNGMAIAYLGISGVDVTPEAHNEGNVPYGAFVKEVEMNSPAMLAGIQKGDIITGIDESEVLNFSNYMSALLRLNAGDTVKVFVERQVQDAYKEVELKITLGEAK